MKTYLRFVAVAVTIVVLGSMSLALADTGDPGEPVYFNVDSIALSPDRTFVVEIPDETDEADLRARAVEGGASIPLNTAVSHVDHFADFVFPGTPDGSTVVFIGWDDTALGPPWRPYAVPVAGGANVQLDGVFGTMGTPMVEQRWLAASNDDLLYIQDGRLFAAPLDGTGRRDLGDAGAHGLTDHGHEVERELNTPIVTSDQSAALVWHETGAGTELVLVALDGSGSTVVASLGGVLRSPTDLVINATGTHAVYRLETNANVFELFSAALDGSGVTKLNPSMPLNGDVKDWAISPDGSLVGYRADAVVNNDNELWVVPVEGGAATRLNRALPTNGDVKAGFVFTPDSQRVIYVADERINNTRELFSISIAGDDRIRLTKRFPRFGDVNDFGVTPDGSGVVFRGDQLTNNRQELFHVPLPDGDLTRLNPGLTGTRRDVKSNFEISPDSTTVVYRGDTTTNGVIEVFAVDIDATSTHKLSGGTPYLAECGSGSCWGLGPSIVFTAGGTHVLFGGGADWFMTSVP